MLGEPKNQFSLTRAALSTCHAKKQFPISNRTVAQIARHYITGPDIPEALLNRVEHGIHCYDPCLSCSTHAAGQMPLRVQLIAADGKVLKEATRV